MEGEEGGWVVVGGGGVGVRGWVGGGLRTKGEGEGVKVKGMSGEKKRIQPRRWGMG